MENRKTAANLSSIKKIAIAILLVVIIFVIVEQVSVYNTLKGDGKTHQVTIEPYKKD